MRDAKLVIAVVLDTNVLVAAAFNPNSHAAKVVQATQQGRFRLVWDHPTRRETERIFATIPPLRDRNLTHVFAKHALYAAPTFPQAFPFIPDPDDRKFAALAAAAGASLITQDSHLLSVAAQMPVPVLTPGALWQGMGEAEEK